MNNLTITLKTSETERYIPNKVVTTLYNIGKDDDENQSLTSGVDTTDANRPVTSVVGNVAVRVAYANQIDYLATKFPNLNISTDSTYIYFEDPEVEKVLIEKNVGDGVGITLQDAALANNLSYSFKNNTDIVKFNEFKYFTFINLNGSADMFNGATNLEEVDFSNTTKLLLSLFSHTGLKTINIPNLLSALGTRLFFECSKLANVVNLGLIPRIDEFMFGNCSVLTDVTLPTSCTTLNGHSFWHCLNLSNINLQNITGLNRGFDFCDDKSLNINVSDLNNDLTSIGNNTFYDCLNMHGILDLQKLNNLGSAAFARSGISKVKNIGKLSNIAQNAFEMCSNLTDVYIPYECTSLGIRAFYNIPTLSSIKQYNKSVDDYAEDEEPVLNPINRVTIFMQHCFYNCNSLSITCLDIQNATTIGEYAFWQTLLSGELNLPNLTGVLGMHTFYKTNITSVSNLGNITEIGDRAFGDTNITSITIPNSIKKCHIGFAYNTLIQDMIFPEGLESLVGGLFATKNNSLTYIELPSTITDMDLFFHRSLEGSIANLCTLVIKAPTPPSLDYYAGVDQNNTRGDRFSGIYVPDESLNLYKNGDKAWLHSSILAKLKPISQLLTDNPTAWAKYNRTSTV